MKNDSIIQYQDILIQVNYRMSGKTHTQIIVLNSLQSNKSKSYQLLLSSLIRSIASGKTTCISSIIGSVDDFKSMTITDESVTHLIILIFLDSGEEFENINQTITRLSEKYIIRKVKIYSKNTNLPIEICDANINGPGYFTLSLFSDFPGLKTLYRISRILDNDSFHKIINQCDKMSMDPDISEQQLESWVEKYLHFHKDLSMGDNFDEIFSKPDIFDVDNLSLRSKFDKIQGMIERDKKLEESTILQTKFLELVQEMKEKSIELPDFQIHYLVTEHRDRGGCVVHISPFLNKSEAERNRIEAERNATKCLGKYWHTETNTVVDSDTKVYLDGYSTCNTRDCEADYEVTNY